MKLQLQGKKIPEDRALTYHTLAKEYHWTIQQIDDSPVEILGEMMIARNTYAREQNRKPKKKKK